MRLRAGRDARRKDRQSNTNKFKVKKTLIYRLNNVQIIYDVKIVYLKNQVRSELFFWK